MHFRILKMIATSGFLTPLVCTRFVFGRGSASGTAGEQGREGREEGTPPNANSWIRPCGNINEVTRR